MSKPTETERDTIPPLVVSAIARAAARMTAESVARSGVLVEADLKAQFKQALVDAAWDQKADAQVAAAEHTVKFAEWPGVGGVDVALTTGAETSRLAFFELKWGSGTLYNCIWDAPKMALAVALGACERAYLVAGAPATDWSIADGSDLFEDGTWTSGELFTRHKKHWDKWGREVKTRPLKVPATFETRLVATSITSSGNALWELRAAQVVPKAGWFEVIQVPEP